IVDFPGRSLRILAGESSRRAERGGTQVRVAESCCACGSTHCGRASLSEHPSPVVLACTGSATAYIQRHNPSLRRGDRKSTRLNSSHVSISYAVFCLKEKTATESGEQTA